MALDISDDFYLFDWRDDVTYNQWNSATETYGANQTINMLRRAVSAGEVITMDSGELITMDTVFHAPVDEFDEPPVKGSKIITDNVQIYIVDRVEHQTLQNRYRMSCHRILGTVR